MKRFTTSVPSWTEITRDHFLETLCQKVVYTYSNLSEAFMEHGHQQLGQDNNHHNIVGAYDHGTHKRAQLLCVGDAGDEERNMCQREDVPE